VKEFLDSFFGVLIIPICFIVTGVVWWLLLQNVEFTLWPAVSFALLVLPLVLPFLLFYLTYERWMEFVRKKFTYESGRVVLRIKLPPEVFKSPEAMESVFENIHAANPSDNFGQAYLDGKHPLMMTCELVSIGGDVRFYMTVHHKIKNMLEAQLYSQYPGLEIIEEPIDYAAEVQWKEDEMDLMSFHFVKKKDPVMPIKTFIDYGHDKLPKEEEKFEPMSAMIEYLGRAKPHERIFFQWLCKPHAEKKFGDGELKYKPTWEVAAKQKINEVLQRDDNRLSTAEETENRPTLTTGERDTISAIERNVGKLAFDTAIRGMYVTMDKTQFDGPKITAMISTFKQFEIVGRNGLGIRWKTDFDYMIFEDFFGSRKLQRKKDELEHYKLRKYDPGSGKKNAGHQLQTMSVEELATMFHIPGRSILTPGMSRISSTSGSAPSNLPIGNIPTDESNR